MKEYDQIKSMLKKVREIQSMPTYGMLKEQDEFQDNNATQVDSPMTRPSMEGGEGEDITTINNVDVKIHSEDPEDLILADDEKQKISQLIDDFRKEVTNLVDFQDLNIYENSAKLRGQISDLNVGFTLSAGDDNGVYLSNTALLKMDPQSLDIINKLTKFNAKYGNIMNGLLVNRKEF